MKKARKPSKKLARRLSARTGNEAIPRKGKREPIKTRAEHLNEESKSVENDLFPIVVVGASAGGLEAFTRFIKDLPADTGMAFVLVQHLDPEHESKLPQLLAKTSKMPVLEVANNTRVQPDHVYVIPPNRSMTIDDRILKLLPRERANQRHRSIDHFFESLANDQRHQAIGVILSGTATDGTLGLQAIKGEGGITFAQDESANALATIKSWKPDCIISDVGMPGEDGYELIKKIRALKKKDRAKTPAIALTGFAGTDDKSKAIAFGYQLHLSKPVDLGTLTSEIARLAQKRSKARSS